MIMLNMGHLQSALSLLLSSATLLIMVLNANGDADTTIQLNDDVLGLIVFKSDLQSPPALSSWKEDDNPPCSWSYVRCDPENGKVSELWLDGLGLSGKIGRGLEKLQGLKVLSLSWNNLEGNLSPELFQLTGLQVLNLSRNRFSGQIPNSVSIVSSIRSLDLSGNSLSGSIPEGAFEGCSSLGFLSLAGNSLEGSLPASLSQCSALNSLNLSSNHFSGNPFQPSSSSGILLLNRLRILDLSNNQFSGSVPIEISSLRYLKQLHLQGNRFSGPIPGDIGLCLYLNTVDLSSNLFNGAIPTSLQKLNSLVHLDLSHNILTGEFSHWIGNMTSLEYIDFSWNGLTGTLPTTMGSAGSLQYLSLSNNQIGGEIPSSLSYCYQLLILRLRGNHLTGSLPDGLFGMGFEELDLSWNELSGPIPVGSSRLFQTLLVLDLSGNNLVGDIPPEIGLFSNLRYLNLSWNNLHSRMPPELGHLQHLTVLDLRNDALHGSIPTVICESGNLAILQLDGNTLSSSIPEELGNCSSLYLLSMSHNNLNGSIPKSLSMLKKLQILRLEFNELTGEIPSDFGGLQSLVAVNVSYNRLIGRLPPGGVFPSLDQNSLQGNDGICSPLLKGPCKMDVQKPLVLDPFQMLHGNNDGNNSQGAQMQKARRFHHHRFLTLSAMVAISAAVAIVAGVVIVSLVNASARRPLAFVDNAMESMCSFSSRPGTPAAGKLILFDSRSPRECSNNNPESLLHEPCQIGGGVFGTVYKATMGTKGRVVAIKNLVMTNILKHPEDFDREARILGKVRHPNLIPLIGYYWNPETRLLVSEYASNGSLLTKLHGRPPSASPLSWSTRFSIILGTAKGLAHLHHDFDPPIIHFNLKPSNILLDDNYNAKISDFAISRLVENLDKHIISNRFQTALGYVAPELTCQSLRINEKCDVYGFGVMVLEIVTGRWPVEYGEDYVIILRDYVTEMHGQGNVLECVDSSMGVYPVDEVLPVLKLALVCTSQIPSSRPSMAEVVQVLQVIKTLVPHRMEIF